MYISKFFSKPRAKMGLALGGAVALGAEHVAFGTSVEEIEEIALDLDWLDVTSVKISKMELLSNKRLGKFVLEHLGKVNIKDARIPLCMIATDLCTGIKVVLKERPLHKAVISSSCLPGILAPAEWDEMLLADGFFVKMYRYRL